MKAEAKRVRELFEGELCLTVPVFQRPYVWNLVRNWEPLWADIVSMADAIFQGPTEPHFLGAVVLDSSEKDSTDIPVLQVIDGQQRLTTLQVALCAVRDALTTADIEPPFINALKRLVTNEDQLSTEVYAPYKVWPTLRDREAFTSIVDHVEPRADIDTRLRDAYDFFYESALTWLGEHASDRARVKSLVDALRNGLQLVVIELTDNDNAQVIFESLNDRGTPLTPSDLVKNSLFQSLERAGLDVEQIFDDHWRRFETPFWQGEVRQGRLIRSRLDAFFAHYLTMRTGEEVLATALFTRFKELSAEMDRDSLVALTEEIADCSEIYRGILERSGSDSHDRLLDTAEALDTSVLAPVVMYLDRTADPDDRKLAFGYIESWLVRRAVLRSTSKNYNRMLLELLRALKNSDASCVDLVRNFLLGNTSESGRWPSDTEVREVLITRPIAKSLSRARVRLVLRGCEVGLNETSDFQTVGDVDYVMLATSEDSVGEELRSALGNLSLVQTSRLRELNQATDWKGRKKILSSTHLRLNHGLPESLDDVEISVRGSRLAEGFLRNWPHPDSESHQSGRSPEPVTETETEDTLDWLGTAWAEIRGFFAGLPIGSVSRVDDRVASVLPSDGTRLEELTSNPIDGYEFRDIAGTRYIEKVGDTESASHASIDPAIDDDIATSPSTGERHREANSETIGDLMYAGLLNDGDRVYHEQPRKGRSFAARITRAGTFLAGGKEFASPSTALSDLVGSSRNGWRDWRLERTGESLEQIRERYRQRDSR